MADMAEGLAAFNKTISQPVDVKQTKKQIENDWLKSHMLREQLDGVRDRRYHEMEKYLEMVVGKVDELTSQGKTVPARMTRRIANLEYRLDHFYDDVHKFDVPMASLESITSPDEESSDAVYNEPYYDEVCGLQFPAEQPP